MTTRGLAAELRQVETTLHRFNASRTPCVRVFVEPGSVAYDGVRAPLDLTHSRDAFQSLSAHDRAGAARGNPRGMSPSQC